MTGSPPLRRLMPILLAACLPLAAAPAAHAGAVIKRDRSGDMRARGLSAKERRALDIRRVELAGGSFGLVGRVTMGGDIERAIGRGRLRNALVAMVLTPRSRRSRASILATRGAGRVGRTLRSTRSRKVLVIRNGRRLIFVILGGGLRGVKRIEFRALARPGARRRASKAQDLGPDEPPYEDYPSPEFMRPTLADQVRFGVDVDDILKNIMSGDPLYSNPFSGRGAELLESLVEDAQAEFKTVEDSLVFSDPTGQRRADLENASAKLRELIAELEKRLRRPQLELIRRICSGPHGGPSSPFRVLIEAIRRLAGIGNAADRSGAGAVAGVRIKGPSGDAVIGGVRKTLTLDGEGRGLLEFQIRSFGDYAIRSSVRLADGTLASATDRFTVQAGQSCSF